MRLTKIDRTGGTTNDWNYTYDTWGGIKKAAHTPSSSDITYTLDALERMLTRTAAGASTAYTYTGEGEDPAKAQVGTGTPTYYAYSPCWAARRSSGDHRVHPSLLHP